MARTLEDPSRRSCSMWNVRAGRLLWLHPSEIGPLWPSDLPLPSPPGFKETAFLYAISSAGLTHALAKACSAGRMERCTCDEAPDLENREAWQWGGCGDNLKYSSKFVKEFLGRRSSKDLRARVDFHNNLVGVKASRAGRGAGKGAGSRAWGRAGHGVGAVSMCWGSAWDSVGGGQGAHVFKGWGAGAEGRGTGLGEGWESEKR